MKPPSTVTHSSLSMSDEHYSTSFRTRQAGVARTCVAGSNRPRPTFPSNQNAPQQRKATTPELTARADMLRAMIQNGETAIRNLDIRTALTRHMRESLRQQMRQEVASNKETLSGIVADLASRFGPSGNNAHSRVPESSSQRGRSISEESEAGLVAPPSLWVPQRPRSPTRTELIERASELRDMILNGEPALDMLDTQKKILLIEERETWFQQIREEIVRKKVELAEIERKLAGGLPRVER
ncbi:hypothetical protein FA15DRAFT_507494 [Coprinopsis marcescibilis]|uniref:Uncharacterized protein n=1 Tax=Coprinopsis marcescibilis TaxID=230819 RepID=A0A5C3L7I0_COPMA|nr:hypothetical protein FA15DRAFT_507494 [Coprinopsis marcescibilis]